MAGPWQPRPAHRPLGWRLKKTHDLAELVDTAIDYNPGFSRYLDLGRRLTAYYVEYRYPPGPSSPPSPAEIEALLEELHRLVAEIEAAL